MPRNGGDYVLNADERRGLRRLAKRGRAGGTVRELANSEAAGVPIGATLVRLGLAVVTRDNRFVLAKYAGKAVPGAIAWDDDRRAGRVPSPLG